MPKQAPKEMHGASEPDASDEQSQAARLHQMRDRLASLSDEARSIRSQVPHEFEPDVERIQQQMQRLGERLSVLGGSALSQTGSGDATSESVSDEVILLGGPSEADNPWDEQSANALTRFYESGEADLGPDKERRQAASTASSASKRSAGESGSGARDIAPIEPARLDERFADIARRIEESLAEIRPESSLLSLGKRFDQLEERMTSALRGVATRADLKELHSAEAQIEEISSQLEQFRRQLARLDAIDAHLGTLASQLSDERLAGLLSRGTGVGLESGRLEAIDAQLATLADQLSHGMVRSTDLEGLADAAAQRAMARIANQEAQPSGLGEVRGLIESLINERRHSDENYASMLETMQQAIIRVLDRIDALELGQQPQGDAFAQPYVPPMMQSQPDDEDASPGYESAQTSEEPDYEPPQTAAFSETDEESSFAPQEPQAGYVTEPFDLDTAFAPEREDESEQSDAPEEPARADVLRHDFIADAHRAKLKAASKLDSAGDLGGGRAGESAASAQQQKRRARRSIFRSPRFLMSILILLAIIPAALLFMPRTPADGVAVPSTSGAVRGQALPGSTDGSGASSPAHGMPSKQTQQLPRLLPAPDKFEDAGTPPGIGGYARVDTAALPDGIATDPGAKPAPTRLAWHLPEERAPIAPGGLEATPAALMQERVLRMNGVDTVSGQGSANGGSPGLPPATVGPFSLRLAAAKGEPSAQFEVASRLAEGKGIDQDLKAATKWYQRSASNGFAMAQFRLGTLYERGVGVKTDLARAKVWYGRAAEQGNVKAMHNLAVLMARSSDTDTDYAGAARWFAMAADRGLPDSQYNLAILYENGLGIAKDDKEAYKWLLLAAKSGDSQAQLRRDDMKARLNKKVRTAAEAAADAWIAKPTDPLANDSRVAGQAWQQGPGHLTGRITRG